MKDYSYNKRVLITGCGIVSSLGTDLDAAVRKIQKKETGVSRGISNGYEKYFGEINGFKAADYIPVKKIRRMDPVNLYTIASSKMALKDAGIDEGINKEDIGIIVGTGFSGLRSVSKHYLEYMKTGIERLSPKSFPNTVYNASAGLAAIELGIKGPNSTVVSIDVAGEYALFYAYLLIKKGMARRMLVVGADELSEPLIHSFSNLGLLSRKERPSIPFTKGCDGFNLGEGGAAVLLESESASEDRGAKILGEVSGFGISGEGDSVFKYSTSTDSIKESLNLAVMNSGCRTGEIDWISAAANGSNSLDNIEANGLTSCFNDTPMVLPLKGYTGDFSSSGILRIVLGIACSNRGFIPSALNGSPYINRISPYIAKENQPIKGSTILHHGLGLGGNSISVLLKANKIKDN